MSDSSGKRFRSLLSLFAFSLLLVIGLGSCDTGVGTEPAPTTLTVSPPSVTLEAFGESTQFTAVVMDQSGKVMPGEAVSWLSGNSSVVSIDSGGLATAEGVGSATITASAGSALGTASLTVAQVVASVGVTPASATLTGPEQALQLSAEAMDANSHPVEDAVFTWSSSNPDCVHVDATGMATSGIPGTATISATSDGVSGTTEIIVLPPPVASVEVTPSNGTILVGQTLQLTAVTKAASGAILTGRAIAWSSSDASTASVDDNGLVTGILAGGPVEITAVSEGKAGNSLVTVPESLSVTSVVGDKDGFGLDLEAGDERPTGESSFDAREPDDPDFTDKWPAPPDFTYTHAFQVPKGGTVSSATIRWLTLGVQDGDSQVFGSDIDMVLELDGAEIEGAFDEVDQFRHNGTSWVEVVGLVEIPLSGPVLELLQDGEVEVQIRILQLSSGNLDGVSFDYSELEVVFQ